MSNKKDPRPIAIRFGSFVSIGHDPGDCWLWTGGKGENGYGHFKVNGVTHKAHRFSYELFVGPIPSGLHIDHLCRNRGCVNPRHLEPVTVKENVARSPIHCANKTHCPRGHAYDLTYKNGARGCRTCCRAYGRAYAAKHAEKRREYMRLRRLEKKEGAASA